MTDAKSAVQTLATERVVASAIAAPNPPALTTANTLESMQVLLQFADKLGSDEDKKLIKQLYGEEVKFLRISMEAIATNKLLQMKFGTGFQSALSLASILKSQYEEDLSRQILSQYTKDIQPDFVKEAAKKSALSGSPGS